MAKGVREAMTEDPRSIGASASVVEAARLMREEDTGSLPVAQADIALRENEKKTGELVERSLHPRRESARSVARDSSIASGQDPYGLFMRDSRSRTPLAKRHHDTAAVR
jgi:CBS domain-containing protein